MVVDGIKFYKTKAGYWENSKVGPLHRYIYGKTNPIPAGCHVHHKDEDKDNNEPDNLECMTSSEHSKLHSLTRKPMSIESKNILRQKAIERQSTIEFKTKMSEARKGKGLGRIPWNKDMTGIYTKETRAKMAGYKGKVHSEETKAKMRLSSKHTPSARKKERTPEMIADSVILTKKQFKTKYNCSQRIYDECKKSYSPI